MTVTDLENNLGRVLGRVRRGEEIVVSDRSVPIAKIVPIAKPVDVDAEEARLIAAGLVRPPRGPLPSSFFRSRGPRVKDGDLVEALRAERDER